MDVGELKAEMEKRFEHVDKRFGEVDKRFDVVDKRFETLQVFIAAENKATRRHFDIAVEKILAERNLSLDQSTAAQEGIPRLASSNTVDHAAFEDRLLDHEHRLSRLEANAPDRAPSSEGS